MHKPSFKKARGLFFWFSYLRWKLTEECGEGTVRQKRCSAEPVPVWVQKRGLGEPKPRILGPRHQPGTRVKSIAKIVEILKIARIPPVRFFILISSPTSPIFRLFRPVLKRPATNIFSAWYAARRRLPGKRLLVLFDPLPDYMFR